MASRVPAKTIDFSHLHEVQTGSGAKSISCPVGTGAVSLGVKRTVREADHSPPSGAEVRHGRAISPLPHTSSWCDA
jgi:hypothetical protein